MTPSRKLRLQSGLLWLHRWLGLTLGFLFVIVALSGSLLLFQPLYFTWAHGHMIPENLDPEPGSVDAWIENAKAVAPGLGEPLVIWPPHVSHNVSDAGMLVYDGIEPGGLGNEGLLGVLVAPTTGEVLGSVDIDRTPAYAPIFLHRDLWAGELGRVVNGIMGVGSLLFLSIGLYLWWPQRGRLLKKLSPRPMRRTFTSLSRLHHWFGVWVLVLLLIMVASGLYLVQPTWVEPVLSVLPASAEAEHAEPAVCGEDRRIGFDAAIARAQELVADGTWRSIWRHDGPPVEWEITFETGGDTNTKQGDYHVLANLDCGTVELRESPATRAPRQTVELWLTGLHDGSLLGKGGEIAVSVLGLVPLLMFVTGFLIWRRKRANGGK